jgi:glycosyltransferase involved in cell wall biosynthesis
MEPRRRPVVIHVMTRLILGGPSRPVAAALDRLGQSGFRPVLVVGPPGPFETPDHAVLVSVPDLPVLQLRTLIRNPSPLDDLRALAGLSRAMRRLKPALIHTHTAKAGALGRLAGWLLRRHRPPAVHTFHGHSLSWAATGALSLGWSVIERALARTATDLIVALSPGQRDELRRYLGAHAGRKTRVLPLAFDPRISAGSDQELEALRARLGDKNQRVLGFVGRGVAVKGLTDLARAHAAAASRDPVTRERLRIVLIGPIEPLLEAKLRRTLAEGGIGEQWLFWGVSSGARHLMQAFDALVLPSRSEGTPVSILEAFSCGLPVIASAVGGVPELLECEWVREVAGDWNVKPANPRGLLVRPGSREGWIAALQRFAQNDRIPGDKHERQQFVQRVFDPDQHVADLIALYESLGVQAGGSPAQHRARGGELEQRGVKPQAEERFDEMPLQ